MNFQLWDFEPSAGKPKLSFHRFDIIQIVDRVSTDWWMGRFGGKKALFPSNYVKVIVKKLYLNIFVSNFDVFSFPLYFLNKG